MPTGNNGATLTEEEMLSQYRGYTDWRIASIRTTADGVQPTSGGTAYYFSNSGKSTNDGLTPSTPLATLTDLENIKSKLKAGDVVYFERGSVFRGSIKANVAGVSYSAYGTGNKPEIYASPVDAAKSGKWTRTGFLFFGNRNVYKYSQTFSSDIGTIVFDGGKQHGIKCIVRTDADGNTYNNTTGKKFESYSDLDENLHFYHDNETGELYLYCEDGNPSYIFDSIEFSVKQTIGLVSADNITFDNLCFKYGGAHGIQGSTRKGLTVQNCEFQWIGGSIQMLSSIDNTPVRYGNAVEIWGGCDRYSIKNCYFNQIYDAAVTFQYSTDSETSGIKMLNVDFSNNVMEHCNYSIEYFLRGGTPETSYIQDVKFNDNLMWYAGTGFCEQRPDKNGAAHIKAWNHPNVRSGYFEINNNLMALSKVDLVQTNAAEASHSPTYSNNFYIQYTGGYLGRSRDVKDKVLFDNSVGTQIKAMLGDSKPTVIFVTK